MLDWGKPSTKVEQEPKKEQEVNIDIIKEEEEKEEVSTTETILELIEKQYRLPENNIEEFLKNFSRDELLKVIIVNNIDIQDISGLSPRSVVKFILYVIDNQVPKENFKQLVLELLEAGLSKYALAKMMGMSYQYLTKLLKNDDLEKLQLSKFHIKLLSRFRK